MLTLVIQAGGESRRMGQNKALIPFLGEPLIARVIKRLAPLADEILVTTNQPDALTFLHTATEPARPLRLIADLAPGRGALGGLYTAVASARHPLVAVVACDMPFASRALFELERRVLISEEADVVLAASEGGFEPLHALYRRGTCLPAIESAINADQWKLISWFPQVNVRVLTQAEVVHVDPQGLAFMNLNTPAEFAAAEEKARTLPGLEN
jgi:molybdopterin-guanine dinucleotide biosynthesis protein A